MAIRPLEVLPAVGSVSNGARSPASARGLERGGADGPRADLDDSRVPGAWVCRRVGQRTVLMPNCAEIVSFDDPRCPLGPIPGWVGVADGLGADLRITRPSAASWWARGVGVPEAERVQQVVEQLTLPRSRPRPRMLCG